MQPDTGDKLTSNSMRGLPRPQEGAPNCAVLRHELWMTTLCPDIKDQTFANAPKALSKVFIRLAAIFIICVCLYLYSGVHGRMCVCTGLRQVSGVFLIVLPPYP